MFFSFFCFIQLLQNLILRHFENIVWNFVYIHNVSNGKLHVCIKNLSNQQKKKKKNILLNFQGNCLQPQKYRFSFENLSKETENSLKVLPFKTFQTRKNVCRAFTLILRHSVRLENILNLQDISLMAPRCTGTDVVILF